MKKLMMAAAIVCAAVVTQAATVQWKSGDPVKPDGSTLAADGTLTISVFLVGSQEAYDAITMDSIWGTYGKAKTSEITAAANYSKTGDGDLGVIAKTPTLTAADYGKTFYAIIVGTYDAAKDGTIDMYTVNKYATEVNSAGSVVNQSSNLLRIVGGGTSGTPVSWTAVPEPTSGLLLLLGVAGLALRRRRA